MHGLRFEVNAAGDLDARWKCRPYDRVELLDRAQASMTETSSNVLLSGNDDPIFDRQAFAGWSRLEDFVSDVTADRASAPLDWAGGVFTRRRVG
jgi:hypothetical protein